MTRDSVDSFLFGPSFARAHVEKSNPAQLTVQTRRPALLEYRGESSDAQESLSRKAADKDSGKTVIKFANYPRQSVELRARAHTRDEIFLFNELSDKPT